MGEHDRAGDPKYFGKSYFSQGNYFGGYENYSGRGSGALIKIINSCVDFIGRFPYNHFMKITDLKKKYKNKWILAEVVKESKIHKIIDMKPLIISDRRDKVYKSLGKLKKGAHVATFYTGEVPPKGMSFTFHVPIKI